jgi:hypothetical protein
MFMEIDGPRSPPPMAEGAYWVFMPFAVLLATPGVTVVVAAILGEPLAPPLVQAVDWYRSFLLAPIAALREVVAGILPQVWDDATRDWPNDLLPFSFAGGAFIASWIAAGLRRALGPVAASVLALAMVLGLGVTFFGLGFLLVAYLLLADDGLAILLMAEENDRAIFLPLLAPPVLAGAFMAVNALLR